MPSIRLKKPSTSRRTDAKITVPWPSRVPPACLAVADIVVTSLLKPRESCRLQPVRAAVRCHHPRKGDDTPSGAAQALDARTAIVGGTRRPQMALGVHSEVGRLRKVMVHRPGLEHARLTPSNAEELLFDDVIWVSRA